VKEAKKAEIGVTREEKQRASAAKSWHRSVES